jgi:prevent-host-death family protein
MDLVHDLVHNKIAMEFNIHEAKTNFSKLLHRAVLGDEIIITKAGVPMVKLVPVYATKGKRPLGFYRGQIWMADDFDAPLPNDILAAFYGEDSPSPERKPVKHAPAKKRKKA